MNKRTNNSQAHVSASPALIERLRAVGNDAVLLRETVEASDSVSIVAAFAALLSGDSFTAPSGSTRKKALNRPCPSLPTETFAEVVLFADRDTLDVMQLVCSFLLDFIKERELALLALRAISEVNIGRLLDPMGDNYDGWLPVVEIVYNDGAGKELVPKSVHQLVPYLRMAFCELVHIDFDGAPVADPAFRDVCHMVFGDLHATKTVVDTLSFICMPWNSLEAAVRGIEAFKSVKNVITQTLYDGVNLVFLRENFFVRASQHAVRLIEIDSTFADGIRVNAGDALSFGFAESAAGCDRCLLGVACEIGTDFLEQKVTEMDEVHHVDFSFKLASVSQSIDSTGFEKYQKDEGRTWLLDDFKNRINVEVMQTMGLVEIHVFSSA